MNTKVKPTKRGRPRSAKARKAILRAARELLEVRGLTGVTIEGIAARAGVGKPTIYRSWPNAKAVAMAALLDSDSADGGSKTRKTGLQGLSRQLRNVGKLFSTPLGRNVTLMVAAADSDTELSRVFRNHFILERREEGRAFIEQALADGEIRDDIDIDTLLDLIYAPVFYRLLIGHQPITRKFCDSVLSHVLKGVLV